MPKVGLVLAPITFLRVDKISKELCREMVMKYHYSGRVPGIVQCYGLFEDSNPVGCVLYSIPASYTLCQGVCGKQYTPFVLELSRLVIITKVRNAASYLVGESLRVLGDHVVVSYADCNDHVGHVGYVYQSTNWLYTGHGNAEPIWIDPRNGQIVSYTRRHIDEKAENIGLLWTQLEKRKQLGKHRYVTFTGNRRFKRDARKALRYEILPYPKGETQRHEKTPDGKSEVRKSLFDDF